MASDEMTDVGADMTFPEHGWSDRLQRAQARNAVQLAAIALLATLCAALGAAVLYLAVFRAPPAYVLRVDSNNDVTWGGTIGAEPLEGDVYVPSQIMRFVEHWRSVTPDNTMQKRNVRRLYCMVSANTPAYARLNDYFRERANDPFQRNATLSVETVVRSISRLGGSTWQAEWYELARSHDGQMLGERQTMKATMIVERRAAASDCHEGNPLGIHVSDLTWGDVR